MSSEITDQYLTEEEYFDEEFWRLQGDAHVPDWHPRNSGRAQGSLCVRRPNKWTTLEEFEKEIEEFIIL
jgi:hypothetical protein